VLLLLVFIGTGKNKILMSYRQVLSLLLAIILPIIGLIIDWKITLIPGIIIGLPVAYWVSSEWLIDHYRDILGGTIRFFGLLNTWDDLGLFAFFTRLSLSVPLGCCFGSLYLLWQIML
jgi:hypothetical protein